MFAYVLILIAVLSRLLLAATPHPEWFNFTAVGGALLYFGARRSWREMLGPLVVLMATDYYLTVSVYHYSFRWQSYLVTWAWYVMAMALGLILLKVQTSFVRVAAGVVLGPTSFFVASNYAVWVGSGMYPRTLSGVAACYVAAIPFYRNDRSRWRLYPELRLGLLCFCGGCALCRRLLQRLRVSNAFEFHLSPSSGSRLTGTPGAGGRNVGLHECDASANVRIEGCVLRQMLASVVARIGGVDLLGYVQSGIGCWKGPELSAKAVEN